MLTEAGWDKIVQAAPGHVASVREFVIDALTPAQLAQLGRVSERMLAASIPTARWSVASARTEAGYPTRSGANWAIAACLAPVIVSASAPLASRTPTQADTDSAENSCASGELAAATGSSLTWPSR